MKKTNNDLISEIHLASRRYFHISGAVPLEFNGYFYNELIDMGYTNKQIKHVASATELRKKLLINGRGIKEAFYYF